MERLDSPDIVSRLLLFFQTPLYHCLAGVWSLASLLSWRAHGETGLEPGLSTSIYTTSST